MIVPTPYNMEHIRGIGYLNRELSCSRLKDNWIIKKNLRWGEKKRTGWNIEMHRGKQEKYKLEGGGDKFKGGSNEQF